MSLNIPLFVLGSAIFVAMLGVGSIVPFLPLYAKEMGASATTMGFIFGAFAFARTLFMGQIGGWSDKKGRKPFIVAGLFGMSISALLMLWAFSPWHLVAIRGLMGVTSAFILPISLALVADFTPIGKEGRMFGNFNTAMLLGLGLGPLMGGLIYDHMGLAVTFWLLAGMCLTATIMVQWWVKDPDSITRKSNRGGWKAQFALLKDRRMLGIFVARAGATMAMGNFMTFLPLLVADRGLSNTDLGVIMAANMLVMTVVQNPAGQLADRFSRVKISVISMLFSAVLKALLPFAQGYFGLMLLSLAEGVSSGVALPCLTAMAVSEGRRLEAGMGVTMAVFILAMSAGMIAGPLLGGLAADCWGMEQSFFITSAFAVTGVICMMVLCRPGRTTYPAKKAGQPAAPI